MIRTKILATLGPASSDPSVLHALVEHGCDAFRINFSHGTLAQHEAVLAAVRGVERERGGTPIAVLADLAGPKIRVGELAGGAMELVPGAALTIQRAPLEGRDGRISTTFPAMLDDLAPGQVLLLDDGKLRVRVVERVSADEVVCEVVHGGTLLRAKGINLPNTRLRISALTDKDRADVAFIATRPFDYVALSFVRRAEDIRELKALLAAHGSSAHVVAKIEKPEALEHIEEIVAESDAIMVARGDLGVEMDLPAVPVAQKRITALCQRAGKPCIVATQMLETMTQSPSPTRAEVSDVANAVLDHTDAVMLSGETAVGAYPVAAVEMMNRILSATQAFCDETDTPVRFVQTPSHTAAALTSAVRDIVRDDAGVVAVAVFTATGATARLLGKSRVGRPILALSPDTDTLRRMVLYFGIQPVRAETPQHTRDVLRIAERYALAEGLASVGDRIVVLSGRPLGVPGHTNTLVVHTVGAEL